MAGNDFITQIVVNGVVKDLRENRRHTDYEPIIYMPEHGKPLARASLPELREYAFHERGLHNNVVFPFLDENPIKGAKNLSRKALAEKYSVKFVPVPDSNDPVFVKSLADDESLMGSISLRSFHIFKGPIIEVLRRKGFFLNNHPGILPTYRGVMSTPRAMANGEDVLGWTLHHVDEGIDTGDILWTSPVERYNPKRAAVLTMADLAPAGIYAIKGVFDRLEAGVSLRGYSQGHYDKKNFTYPTQAELDEWKKSIALVDEKGMTQKIVEEFSVPGTSHAKDLTYLVTQAFAHWKRDNMPQEFARAAAGMPCRRRRKAEILPPPTDLSQMPELLLANG